MEALDLVNTLKAHDVEIRAEGGMIKWYSPRGPISPTIKEQMAKHKGEILTLLKGKRTGIGKMDKSPQSLNPKAKAGSMKKAPAVLKPQQNIAVYSNRILYLSLQSQLPTA